MKLLSITSTKMSNATLKSGPNKIGGSNTSIVYHAYHGGFSFDVELFGVNDTQRKREEVLKIIAAQ